MVFELIILKVNLELRSSLRVFVALKYSNTYINQSKIDKVLFLEKKIMILILSGFEKNVKKE